MPRQPLPRYRVRRTNSRFYPWKVWDAVTQQTVLTGYAFRREAQIDADRLNEQETTQ